ncbi:PfkB family carbohydrate kinase [Metabacillus sp. RGM 3146]|uniref:PfkB family carbohydrate kinase n=1 Tax=Metabacillus sp. RGM 3146 TaxID=3401092 RepID=UPI003B998E3C
MVIQIKERKPLTAPTSDLQSEEQIRAVATTLIEKGLKNVIVTMGSRKVMWVTKEDVHVVDSHKVKAVDTTGAGDDFIGCFSHYFVKNGDMLEAIKMATAFAALSVTKWGTQASYPSLEEVEGFLETFV